MEFVGSDWLMERIEYPTPANVNEIDKTAGRRGINIGITTPSIATLRAAGRIGRPCVVVLDGWATEEKREKGQEQKKYGYRRPDGREK